MISEQSGADCPLMQKAPATPGGEVERPSIPPPNP